MTHEEALRIRDFLLVVDLMNAELDKPDLSPAGRGLARGAWLWKSLEALAASHGVKLKGPAFIDSRGEFSIQGMPARENARSEECGPLGAFSSVLNSHHPRTGAMPGAILMESSSWCYMNHFEVERMVVEKAAESRAVWNEYVMKLRIGEPGAQPTEVPLARPSRRLKAV